MDTILFTIGEAPPPRLDKALARNVPEGSISRSRLMKLLADGAVKVNGVVAVNPRAKVAEGDEVEIVVPEASETHMLPEDIPLDILFEDDDLLVVNKPAGMVVHPAPGTPSGTLVNALLHHFGDNLSGVGGVKRPGIVHRIDKDTSGLLVIAKSDAAHSGLAVQFEKHKAEREYQAICYGVPDAGDPRLRGLPGISFEIGNVLKITTGLARHKYDRQKQAVVKEGGRHAVTRVFMDESLANGGAALITCRLETGRTHQIRVHMTYAGHSLIGDQTYGGRKRLKTDQYAGVADFPRQALHAKSLGFTHPITGKLLRFDCPIPKDMADLLDGLR